MRLGTGRRGLSRAALLDAAVPRADVLADVAAVDLGAELSRYSSGIAPGACVQYERQRVESSVPGSSSAPGRAGVDAERHEPQSSSSGSERSISASVTSVPSTTQEPWRRVISIVFLP